MLPLDINMRKYHLAKEEERLKGLVNKRFRGTRDLRASWHDRNAFREHGEQKLKAAQDASRAFEAREAHETAIDTTHIRSLREKQGGPAIPRPGSPMPAKAAPLSERPSTEPLHPPGGFRSREIRQMQAQHVADLRGALRDLTGHPARTPADAHRRLRFAPTAGEIFDALRHNGHSPAHAAHWATVLGAPMRGMGGFNVVERQWRRRLNLPL